MRRDPCIDHLRGPLLIVASIRGTCASINWIVTLLSVIMLGTGATIWLDDFLEVVQRPFDVTFGLAGWFLIMPLLAVSSINLIPTPRKVVASVIPVVAAPAARSRMS